MSEDMSFHDEEEKEDDFTKKNIKPNDMNNTQTSKVSKSSKSSKTSSLKSKEKNDENSSKISGSKNSGSINSGSKKLKLKSSNQNSQNSNTNQTTPDENVSTRTYLEQNVVSVVQEGMYELAKTRPDNPLEFLGNYILERAKNK